MKTIVLLNQKGGVGKTTSTINIGAGLTRAGKKVLLIDLDPQASMTYSLGVEADELNHTVYDVLAHQLDYKKALQKKHGISFLPASIALSAFEVECSKVANNEFILKEILSTITEYDYIFIDCPPSLGLLTLNALAAAQEVFIPVQSEYLALQGLSQLLNTLDVVRLRINPHLKIGGILATRYNRRKINKDIIGNLQQAFGDKVFQTVIRENVNLIEAPSFGQDIFSYNPDSMGAEDYGSVCAEFLDREKKELKAAKKSKELSL